MKRRAQSTRKHERQEGVALIIAITTIAILTAAWFVLQQST